MDLPLGTPVKEGMDTGNVDFRKLLPALKEHQLTGYVVTELLTNSGIEEGILLYGEGEVAAAQYAYVAKGLVIKGDGALKLMLNACAGDGKLDICELEDAQMVAAREGDRECVLKYKPTEEELLALLPDTFAEIPPPEKAEKVRIEAVKAMGGVSKEDVLKKYGISHPDEKALEGLLKGLGTDE